MKTMFKEIYDQLQPVMAVIPTKPHTRVPLPDPYPKGYEVVIRLLRNSIMAPSYCIWLVHSDILSESARRDEKIILKSLNVDKDQIPEFLESVARYFADEASWTTEELQNAWEYFGDIPMNPENELMEQEFLHFPARTHREKIWEWFDHKHPDGVHALLNPSN